eukprot:CAMPEP_0171181494 /NCGR_PEP_ID=MMETSP0790-20130122/14288_1 /TAXON_ID=2925 /ORGANISM="Alexandrium catenella, Strain OF101" /LENGTH=403 /DNA_ID=CAMNT_0011646433 /DNA_START=64 /DNA_END=1275 /DNA_ORIENTATION=-
MKHMCSWSGGANRCGRCGDHYCKYHSAINNGGAKGGHQCCCGEGRKKLAFGVHCLGNFFTCPDCGQTVCHYHGPPNDEGSVGGHNGCNGAKCEVKVGGLTCGGKVTTCLDCEYTFCSNHIKGGLMNGVNGHACDVGCATTTHTKVNCVGKRADLVKCKLCAVAGNDYSYCSYHAMPVRTLISIGAEGDQGGGHVCQGYTRGSMLFGDNFGDLFLLATDMAVTVATVGAVNPAAATIAGNSVKIAVYELFELIGIEELMALKPHINALIAKTAAKRREQETKKLPEPEPLDMSDTKALVDSLKKISELLEKYNKAAGAHFAKHAKAVEEGTKQIQGIVNGLNNIIGAIELAQTLKSTVVKLTDALKKPVNPVKVIDAVKECKSTLDQFASACGAWSAAGGVGGA